MNQFETFVTSCDFVAAALPSPRLIKCVSLAREVITRMQQMVSIAIITGDDESVQGRKPYTGYPCFIVAL